MTRRLLLNCAVLLVAALGAWVAISAATSDDPEDWSALPAVDASPAPIWEPAEAQVGHLTAVDPCALLLAIDPDVAPGPTDDLTRDSAEPVGAGCRTTPSRDRLEVLTSTDPATVGGLAGYHAWIGDEVDLAGFTGWSVAVADGGGQCVVQVAAGSLDGLVVRAADGPLCRDLPDRVDRALTSWATDPASVVRRGETPPAGDLPFTPVGEVSLRGVGSCADLLDQFARSCAEHVDREVPEPGVAMVREGEADPDLLCTVALPAAEAAGVEDARAVAAGPAEGEGRTCVLIADGRGRTVTISASRDPMQAEATLELAGHPARVNPNGAPVYEIALTEPDERGHVRVAFESQAGSGSPSEPDWAQPLLEELAEALLG